MRFAHPLSSIVALEYATACTYFRLSVLCTRNECATRLISSSHPSYYQLALQPAESLAPKAPFFCETSYCISFVSYSMPFLVGRMRCIEGKWNLEFQLHFGKIERLPAAPSNASTVSHRHSCIEATFKAFILILL